MASRNVEEKARRDHAKRLAAIRSAVRNAPPISPAELGSIVRMLAAAGDGAS